ncbi:putative quinol monooxygenase [Pleionea sediminis]|uniref:putative quinol monooxygenase n=1 Tax=Pleionea sediminis TaxID=2569479 RepID=UPI001FEC88E8|nr:antibiotic biosynthesis monooxygenase [Pleionea sediminis]
MNDNKAILALLDAKPEYAQDVEALLTSAIELANQEVETLSWFAIKLSETQFGIFDTFENEDGRNLHLEGKIAEALLSKADLWLTKSPDILMANVLAVKKSG